MPSVEEGIIILIGATTHNPFFAINGPLLSRSMIFELSLLEEKDLVEILNRGIHLYQKESQVKVIHIDETMIKLIAKQASGDARRALNTLDLAFWLGFDPESEKIVVTPEIIAQAFQKRIVQYDKKGDQHYDMISAFIKSLRGSDPNAAVYWLAKMLYAGEDIRFIMRRMLILASEDIGNADPNAIVLASSCLNAVECVGLPEGRIILSQCAIYLATTPKSNASYLAIDQALEDVKEEKTELVPEHLKGTGYSGAKKLGHGKGYKYPHAHEGHYVEQKYWSGDKIYYKPTRNGYESKITEYLNSLNKIGNPET